MNINSFEKCIEHISSPLKAQAERQTCPVQRIKMLPADCFVKGERVSAGFKPYCVPFTYRKIIKSGDIPSKGTQLPISAERLEEILSQKGITHDKTAREWVSKILRNETVTVTDDVEREVMQRQFEKYGDIDKKNIFIFSPTPYGLEKSYTRSGETFARVNDIPENHIIHSAFNNKAKNNNDRIPVNVKNGVMRNKDAVVFVPDDCSITGVSMVSDVLRVLPDEFQGTIVFAPTVTGSSERTFAKEIFEKLSQMSGKDGPEREKIINDLISKLSDGKGDNGSELKKLLETKAKHAKFETAVGSLIARNYRETETYMKAGAVDKSLQTEIDKIFTNGGLNNGYHNTNVMVMFENTGKTPNNNAGIMELIAHERGLTGVKSVGDLSYETIARLRNEGKRPELVFIANTEIVKNGQKEEKVIKGLTVRNCDKTKYGTMPYTGKDPLDIKIKTKDGSIKTVRYLPKIEKDGETISGFEFNPKEIPEIDQFKGQLSLQRIPKLGTLRSDVLAFEDGTEVISIGGVPFSDICKSIVS